MSVTDSERRNISVSQAVKPLPPLPRGWSRVCHELGLFLRGIGLGIVVTSVQGVFTKNFPEPEKVAIRESRVTALLRTLIHVVPVAVAIFEIVFNLKGHFVGQHFDKQNYLQFAVKAHEITLQASVATILLSYIRYQTTGTGGGLPFGAVLGGLQFLQVSYLWSMEFWSSIFTEKFQPSKKIFFTFLILTCVAVVTTAGPSSATLLIPRQGIWPLTSTYLAVNASVQDFWPDRLDDDNKIARDCATFRLDSNSTQHCSLMHIYSTYRMDIGVFASFEGMVIVSITSSGSDLVRQLVIFKDHDQFTATVPLTELTDRFYLSTQATQSPLDQLQAYHFIQKNYYQPYTAAGCVADSIKDAYDQTPLQFARISELRPKGKEYRETLSVPSLTKGSFIQNLPENSSDFHVNWVDLPTDDFETGIPGVVIVAPNSQDLKGSSYDVFTCTLNAGWGSSAIGSSSPQSEVLVSHITNTPYFWPTFNMNPVDKYSYLFTSLPVFANYPNFLFPQRRISASKNWMETLNPTVVLTDNSTRKYIPLVLSSELSSVQLNVTREEIVAWTLTTMLTAAMADTGAGYDWKVFSDFENATRTCEKCLIFEIESTTFGWLYSANGKTTILAITVMFAYCVLVMGHIIYSAISGVSSTAWDSVAEMAALGMNSSPTKVLQNTCAGILGRQAFMTPVRILVTAPGHLELVFEDGKDPRATSELVMNEKYGRLEEKDRADGVLESDGQGTLRHRAAAQSTQ